MSDATSSVPLATPPVTPSDLTGFVRLDSLGLQVTAQQVWPDKTVLFCTPTVADDSCRSCAQTGTVHDQVIRGLWT